MDFADFEEKKEKTYVVLRVVIQSSLLQLIKDCIDVRSEIGQIGSLWSDEIRIDDIKAVIAFVPVERHDEWVVLLLLFFLLVSYIFRKYLDKKQKDKIEGFWPSFGCFQLSSALLNR